MREYEKLKQQKEQEEKIRQQQKNQELEESRARSILMGNPLLMGDSDYTLTKR